jgi:V/A-type H+-transporting ATPase subunit I
MLKVTVLGYRPVLDEVISALQRGSVLEIEAQPFDLPAEEILPDDQRLRELDEQGADARFVEEFLGRYHVNEQPFSAFVTEKFHVDEAKYFELGFDGRFKRLYREALTISDRLASGEREKARLEALCEQLEPWTEFRLQIEHWRRTESTVLFTGTVPTSEGPAIREALRDQVAEFAHEELGPVGGRQAWVVIAHACCAEEVRSVLAINDFAEVSFPDLFDYPAEELARARARVAEIEGETERLTGEATRLSEEHYLHAVTLVQAVESERDRLLVRRDFARTDSAFVISGWVRADGVAELHEVLGAFRHLDISVAEPGDDDSPPIELDNPRWLKPLEVLTDLYGRPQYNELDPTILLAPFFLAFFGICISDVGYGAMIIGGAYYIKKRIDVTPGVKRFLSLLMYGGVAAMGFGVAFASYFALPVDMLPPFLANLQVLDPLTQLTTFLLFTLVLGVIQVFFGVFIAAFDAFRRGDPAEAIYGQLSTIFLFVCIAAMVVTGQGIYLSVGLVATMLMQGRALGAALGNSEDPAWQRAVGIVWLVAALASAVIMGVYSVATGLYVLAGATILCAVISRPARKAFLGLLGGAYAVYGMSAFVGDILSYTRLAALGLSGALVGYVFNLLAGLVWGPAAGLFAQGGIAIVFGALVAALAVAVFVVGHTFNVVINLLGAFVHPARLQFVEFFGKFYEGGGQPFSPLRFRTDSLVLETGDAGSKGGTSS